VRYDEEKTGFGWRTDAFIDARDTVPPIKCQMERPSKE
jgi:branched-chain amino acid transport system substrate-binding protein